LRDLFSKLVCLVDVVHIFIVMNLFVSDQRSIKFSALPLTPPLCTAVLAGEVMARPAVICRAYLH